RTASLAQSGTEPGRDAAAIVTNASGTVHSAGCARRTDATPGSRSRTTEASAAPVEVHAPTSRPAVAPVAVRPRHQIPRVSSGQKVEAATANAQPTSTLMSTSEAGRESATASAVPTTTP